MMMSSFKKRSPSAKALHKHITVVVLVLLMLVVVMLEMLWRMKIHGPGVSSIISSVHDGTVRPSSGSQRAAVSLEA